MKSKTIKLFLEENSIQDIVSAEIGNFTGKVLTFPRTHLSKLLKREELQQAGIYILASKANCDRNETSIYIGRSENILSRLKQHDDENNDFWERGALIFAKDGNLTQSHIIYLENKLIKSAIKSKSAILKNVQLGELTNLPESDVCDMGYFAEQIELLLPIVGFNYFEAATEINKKSNIVYFPQKFIPQDSPVFHMNTLETDAYAQKIDGKFIVFKDSVARNRCVNSFAETYKQLRERLIKEGKLSFDRMKNQLVFTQDVSFKSATAAAAVIGGGNLSGRATFKIINTNTTYGEWIGR